MGKPQPNTYFVTANGFRTHRDIPFLSSACVVDEKGILDEVALHALILGTWHESVQMLPEDHDFSISVFAQNGAALTGSGDLQFSALPDSGALQYSAPEGVSISMSNMDWARKSETAFMLTTILEGMGQDTLSLCFVDYDRCEKASEQAKSLEAAIAQDLGVHALSEEVRELFVQTYIGLSVGVGSDQFAIMVDEDSDEAVKTAIAEEKSKRAAAAEHLPVIGYMLGANGADPSTDSETFKEDTRQFLEENGFLKDEDGVPLTELQTALLVEIASAAMRDCLAELNAPSPEDDAAPVCE